ncbi:hypothetical protein F0562_002635 [Nyssa sinensis]|uniref:Uncharacterized protein n=1 Tax=Nyssa sinensis TaxID=561372 RepID=A0A5J5BV86_9ASTE|nr:hypothetical protein F0562_002635 [Nyssa sinensis]
MFKLSPSGNQRSKGFKARHALLISLSLGVCIWLLHQEVQHSHTREAAFGEGTKMSENVQNENEILKLGRKDLHPQTTGDERHKEGQEEEKNKPEEGENERNGGGDDEREHGQEKEGEEGEHRGDFADGQKKSEKIEKGDKIEDSGSLEDQVRNGNDTSNEEATEEHHDGDTASTEVVQDSQNTTETEKGGLVNSNGEEQKEDQNELQENNINNTEVINVNQNDSGLSVRESETVEKNNPPNVIASEGKSSETNLLEKENSPNPNTSEQQQVNDNSMLARHDPADSSIPQEEKVAGTDRVTLQETKTEGNNNEDAVAE